MKFLLSILILLTLIKADKLETSKTSCIQQTAYANKTLDEQKKILIEKAKQESLEELYGTLISSSIYIKDGKLITDSIKSRAVGTVRVKGNPLFYNGKNLGEICTDINVYITKKDLEKYRPKKVSLRHFCFNDPTVAIKDIKQQAKYSAYKEIISQYKASLKLSGEQAEQFIHEFVISNDKFDFDTTSYCFDVVGTILPYELEMGSNSKKPSIIKNIFSNKNILLNIDFSNNFKDKSNNKLSVSSHGVFKEEDFGYFNGKSFLQVSNSEVLNITKENYSIYVEFKINNNSDEWQTIVEKGLNNNQDYLITINNGVLRFWQNKFKTDIKLNEKLIPDKWYKLVIIQNIKNNQISLFLDGVLRFKAQIKGDVSSNNNDLYIGYRKQWGRENLSGAIRHLIILNKVLNEREIEILNKENFEF